MRTLWFRVSVRRVFEELSECISNLSNKESIDDQERLALELQRKAQLAHEAAPFIGRSNI